MTMLITGFVGNALAMLLVSQSYRRRESKRKKSFLLCIGWLALTDLVGQLLTSPVVIVLYLSHQRWEQLDPSGRLCTFFGLTMTVFGLSSLFIASAMAVERALATRAPHWYSSHMKTSATRSVLLGVWLAVLAFALLPVLGVGQYTIQWPGTWCFISTGAGGNGTSPSHNWGNMFFASSFAFLGLSALAVTFACNLATIKALVSRCRAKATASQSSAQWGRITTETAIQLMGIMCVLSVCWSPLLTLYAFSSHKNIKLKINSTCHHIKEKKFVVSKIETLQSTIENVKLSTVIHSPSSPPVAITLLHSLSSGMLSPTQLPVQETVTHDIKFQDRTSSSKTINRLRICLDPEHLLVIKFCCRSISGSAGISSDIRSLVFSLNLILGCKQQNLIPSTKGLCEKDIGGKAGRPESKKSLNLTEP
eukprot:bmy_08105T0